MTSVSIIISNFNGSKYLARLIDSLRSQQGVQVEIIVVDRESTDDSAAILARSPDVKVVSHPPRTGLVSGYAEGVPHASHDLLFFCNEDMWFDESCLSRLANEIDLKRKVACADPWQWTYDGDAIIHSGEQLAAGGWHRASPHPLYFSIQTEDIKSGSVVSQPCAGAMMIHKFAYQEVQGWDRSYFLDYEDSDLAIRLWQHGWWTVSVPAAKVYHALGASNSKTIGKKISVSKRRYVMAGANRIITAWKLFSPHLWPLPIMAWCDLAARNCLRLRFSRVLWDFLTLWQVLKQLPKVAAFRNRNCEVSLRRPGENYYSEPRFQSGAVFVPSLPEHAQLTEAGDALISVAIVTRNRPDSLRRCLTSWNNQSVRPHEIVVSDDSDEKNAVIIKGIAEEYGVRYINGPRRGLYANRNHAANSCTGTHVLSGDDDHEHSSDYLAIAIESAQLDPQGIWCFGEAHSQRDFEARKWTSPGQMSASGASQLPHDPGSSRAWSDGATLCPRSLFQSGLAFYEGFVFGASYLEFGCLVWKLGHTIRVVSRTGVLHHIETVGRSYELTVEETASRYFAAMMLATQYLPTARNVLRVSILFLRDCLRSPVKTCKAWRSACRHVRTRRREVTHWMTGNSAMTHSDANSTSASNGILQS